MSAPVIASLLLLATVLAYGRLLTWRHRREARRRDHREQALVRVEPFALGLIDGDLVLPNTDDAPALSALLTDMAPAIAGESRQSIADYFLSNGDLDRACAGLSDRRWSERARHAAALGDMCHVRAEEPLVGALADPQPEVRLAATRSLGRLRAESAVDPVIGVLLDGTIPAAVGIAALLAIGTPALGAARRLIHGDEGRGIELGIDILSRLGSSEDVDRLRPHLDHQSAAVRGKACQALGRLGDPGVAATLAGVLADEDEGVRMAAARALEAVGDRSVVPALIRLAQTDAHDVAMTAANAVSVVAPDLAVRMGRHPSAGPALRHAASLAEVRAA